jgi:FkbM family methyltransferase
MIVLETLPGEVTARRISFTGGETGDFARRTWHHSTVHMVEPQVSCRLALKAWARQLGFVVHLCAIGDAEGVLTMAADPAATSPGAHVLVNHDAQAKDKASSTIETPVKTLDALFAGSLPQHGSALLKLDLQEYELHALRGAYSMLRRGV